MDNPISELPFSDVDLETCLRVLQEVSEAPEMMNDHARFKSLVTKVHRQAKRKNRAVRKAATTTADRNAIESTQIVRQQMQGQSTIQHRPIAALNSSNVGQSDLHGAQELVPADLKSPRRCYVCKQAYTRLHDFYHQMCPVCSELNWSKRQQRADLTGRVALITGGRIKIGFETALKLLRDGAKVIATTRFPIDAAKRYAAEPDFKDWEDRLQIRAVDLRNIPAVESLAGELSRELDSLDILIHNAAQTVKRPLAFYQHLLDARCDDRAMALIGADATESVLLETGGGYGGHLANVNQYFPEGCFDLDGQQVDQRGHHSWMMKLDEITTIELLETYLVSAAAPFVLTRLLKPLMIGSPHGRRFIVNVSAMEGQFERENKTAFHPHTNMAKAAMNMMTRTSAADFANDGIFMNSVDTGWITDEKPLPIAQRVQKEQAFYPPLDIVDGAARIYDPIARGCNESGKPLSGHFLKDYAPYAW